MSVADNESVTGLIAIDKTVTCHVEYIAIRTPHIVLATGGPASVYADSVYPLSHTGNSSLALTAGAEFANLSEWQYGLASIDFRWNVSGSYQQVLPRYISVDDSGVEREFLREHFENDSEVLKNIFLKGYEWPFDVRKLHGSSFIDLLVYRESVVLGRSVFMDFTREPSGIDKKIDKLDEVTYNYLNKCAALVSLPIERLRKTNPDAISLYASHGIDLSLKPLRIAVCAQHNNGGIRIDANWQSSIKGLYAAGEAAGSLGVFRPGGSALNSCMVGSMRAAEHIAKKSNNKVSDNFDAVLQQELIRLNSFIKSTAAPSSTLDGMRHIYQSRMSSHFAFLRDISLMSIMSPYFKTQN